MLFSGCSALRDLRCFDRWIFRTVAVGRLGAGVSRTTTGWALLSAEFPRVWLLKLGWINRSAYFPGVNASRLLARYVGSIAQLAHEVLSVWLSGIGLPEE